MKKLKLNESTISMLLGVLVVIVVGALVINYFRNVRQPAEEVAPIQITDEEVETINLADLPTTYTVKAGDHLWGIAEEIYGSGYNWVDIATENDLSDPDGLAVGQQLTIPLAQVREATMAAKTTVFGPAIAGSSYQVQEGDHLWGIAVRAYGDGYQWVKIANENDLANPNLIHPGNVLQLPR